MKYCAALAASLLLFAAAEQPDRTAIPFRHVVIDDHQAPPGAGEKRFHGDCKGVGDINGDGYVDVVFGGSEFAWYEYPTWKKHVLATTDSEFSTDMQIADVNGDGAIDIIVPEGKEGKLWWFENPGRKADPRKAPSWKKHLITQLGTFVHDLEVGDIDGDGKLDVVTRKLTTTVWLQKGSDSFQEVKVPTANAKGEGLALGDLNGDGLLDIVQEGYWLECPKDIAKGEWTRHEFAQGWPRQVGVTVTDMNGDKRPDILIAPAESPGRLSWFEAPENPATGTWIEHVVDPDVSHIHTFKVADMNNDGQLEIVTAEMQQSKQKRVTVYHRMNKTTWKAQVIATTGSHNIRLADIGGDGDIDIVGANWGGPWHPVEMWENLTADRAKLNMDTRWKYTQADNKRAKWGDESEPKWMKYFGLGFGDIDGDGITDIVSGRYWYKGGKANWQRTDFGANVDAVLVLPAEKSRPVGVIAESLPDVYWMYPKDKQGKAWEKVIIGSAPKTDHRNGQGYVIADLDGDRKPLVVLSAKDGVYAFKPPANAKAGNWPRRQLTDDSSEEGIGVGDIDGDGKLDIATSSKDGHTVYWWKNSGPNGVWQKTLVGKTERWADRCGIADINGDGRPDIVVTEETAYAPASVYWYENPKDPHGDWKRHTVVTQYTTNSMDLYDMNGDGRIDIITGEHRGSRKLAWWENRGGGAEWIEHVIDTGKENHLGARVFKVSGKGGLGIASIAWDTYQFLHVWTGQ